MTREVIDIFEVPKEVESIINKIISKDEEELIVLIKRKTYSEEGLIELVNKNLQVIPKEFINNCYKRNIIDKVIIENKIFYKVSSLYYRLSVFAQYEPEKWIEIDENLRKIIDEWYVKEYAKRSIDKVEKLKNGEISAIENAYFITLEESLELLENKSNDIYILPCNCKSLAKNCNKPINVCIQFENGINTMVDREWGEKISKEKAKEITIKANKSGLMHSSECESALCNCDGCCCYPIRAAKILNVEKEWPKKVHKIIWDKDKCTNCGKCSKICNFNAFIMNNKTISFDENKCWGCTICKDNCPTKAITLKY
ncbi:4Fe-4S binding protein [[Clostridium] dakarense]|uniref:4Fe-4S binding protein n=1 Tax=Faecalimicrobium dakarense TaxID=1301100 RepID=UPI0004B79E46|nr:4Fe-4S binding protein [[Clostridium] dakarense]